MTAAYPATAAGAAAGAGAAAAPAAAKRLDGFVLVPRVWSTYATVATCDRKRGGAPGVGGVVRRQGVDGILISPVPPLPAPSCWQLAALTLFTCTVGLAQVERRVGEGESSTRCLQACRMRQSAAVGTATIPH